MKLFRDRQNNRSLLLCSQQAEYIGVSCDGIAPIVGGDRRIIGGAAMNMQKLSRRLQMALCARGRHIKINQLQHYSDRQGRMVTKYVLSEKKMKNNRPCSVEILSTYRMSEVIKALAQALRGGDGEC